MKNRSNQILSIRLDENLKEHIKATAKPNVNAWIVAKLKKASKYGSNPKV